VAGEPGSAQATVRSFDPVTRGGDVLLDDGTVLAFEASAFDPSGLRLLRLGQRVRLHLDAAGTVTFITIVTFADPA
jgi:2-phospho-L-lactate/phosphoenolpyruvate guanylyltransferase